MTPINHPRMSHQLNDTKYKICCQYAETLTCFFNGEGAVVNHPILGEGEPRGGAYQSVTDTKWRGEGAVVSHPFLGGGGSQGEAAYQSVTGTKWRGEGVVVSPFLEE